MVERFTKLRHVVACGPFQSRRQRLVEFAAGLRAESLGGSVPEEVMDHLKTAVAEHDQPTIRQAARRICGALGGPGEEVGQLANDHWSTNDGDRSEQCHGVVGKSAQARRNHLRRAPILSGREGVQPERRSSRETPDLGRFGCRQVWRQIEEQRQSSIAVERLQGDRNHAVAVEGVADGVIEGGDRRRVPPGDDDEQRFRVARGRPKQIQAERDAQLVGPLDVVEGQEGRPELAHRPGSSFEDPDRFDGPGRDLRIEPGRRGVERGQPPEHLASRRERHLPLRFEALGAESRHPFDPVRNFGD
jgi:hypothetical protein